MTSEPTPGDSDLNTCRGCGRATVIILAGFAVILFAVLSYGTDVFDEQELDQVRGGLGQSAYLPTLRNPAEGPVYSLQVLANVDTLTASGTLETLKNLGYIGFMTFGSASDGYDLYRPDLHYIDALDLEAEFIRAGLISGTLPPGFFVVETDSLR